MSMKVQLAELKIAGMCSKHCKTGQLILHLLQ